MKIMFLFLATFCLLQGCGPKLDITPAEVVVEIEAVLETGDSRGKIEEYFKTQKLSFSFDEVNNRYQSIIRHPKSNYHAIVIYIWLDEKSQYKKAEAHDSYTTM